MVFHTCKAPSDLNLTYHYTMGSPAILGFQPRPIGLKLIGRPARRLVVYGLLFVLFVFGYLCYAQPQTFKDHVWWRVREGALYALHVTRDGPLHLDWEQ